MKKSIILFITIILIAINITSCETSNSTRNNIELESVKTKATDKEENRLNSPNISFDKENKIISWNAVPNADYYIIQIGTEDHTTENLYWDVSDMLRGNYNVAVHACSHNNKYESSIGYPIIITIEGINQSEASLNIKNTYIKSCVLIKIKHYNTTLGITTDSWTYKMQGVIYEETSNKFKILTRNFGFSTDKNYEKRKITVIDYRGNEYTAQISQSSVEKELENLTGLTISKSDVKTTLEPISLANKNPIINQEIITINMENAYYSNFNTVKQYTNVNLKQGVNCFTTDSSCKEIGCAVLNSKYELVGITLGELTTGDPYVLPIATIKKFC